ncbi:conserved hypothetical protein [Agrobacterium deltaense Zutra 3/1]|uniref:Uncharacterized protein n=1 Tax=Agrobacterium deltaense Zutra 3/1 TaxID=1183427 RepID=A0A1S7S757_9HYPH|nr:conserved hypothetical protein [Agrobacterium deltaense Zutra 3/1]
MAPISSRDSRMCWKTCHLLATASDATAFATIWLARWPSVIGRRPKDVVEICVCISFYLLLGNRNPPVEMTLSLTGPLTTISGNAILLAARLQRRSSGTPFRGPFSFAVRASPSQSSEALNWMKPWLLVELASSGCFNKLGVQTIQLVSDIFAKSWHQSLVENQSCSSGFLSDRRSLFPLWRAPGPYLFWSLSGRL